MKKKYLFLIAAFIIFAAVIILASGCASDQHRRELLEAEHPDCFVMQDLTMECPNPFTDQSVGFGTSVTNEKIKVKSNEKRKRNVKRRAKSP